MAVARINNTTLEEQRECLPTLLIVGDQDGELLPGLQPRIKTSGISTGRGQVLAGR